MKRNIFQKQDDNEIIQSGANNAVPETNIDFTANNLRRSDPDRQSCRHYKPCKYQPGLF